MSVLKKRKRLSIRVKDAEKRIITGQASNDLEPDSYRTRITVESLHDWAVGFNQHKTVSKQHNQTSHGLEGAPQVGMGLEIRFNPQLEVDVRIDDPETWSQIEAGEITGFSLEFYPTKSHIDEEVEVFTRLSQEPEMCGLTVTNAPSVPGALFFRMAEPNWSHAVVDPAVLNGTITDPEKIERLRWLPHHDLQSHLPDPDMLARALGDLNADRLDVPEFATLSREQIKSLAFAHLERHRPAMRSTQQKQEGHAPMKKAWLKNKAAAYVIEGRTQEAADAQALADWNALSPQTRSEIEEKPEPAETPETPAAPATVPAAAPAAAPEVRTQAPATDEAVIARMVEAELAKRSEPSHAALAQYGQPAQKMDGEQLLNELFMRSVCVQATGEQITSEQNQEIENLLVRNLGKDKAFIWHNGIKRRALDIENNGTVLYTDIARLFAVKPSENTIGRNHFPTVNMAGVSSRDFPKMDGSAMDFEWDKTSIDDEAEDADPTNSVFTIAVATLSGATPPIADNFLRFNAAGQQYVSQYLIPEMRKQAQIKEDKALFLSTGSTGYSTKFKGLKTMTGVTAVSAGTNGDAFTLDILDSMLRAMPTIFSVNVDKWAFYLENQLAWDYLNLLGDRATNMGDRVLERYGNVPGPLPVGMHRNVPVFNVPWLPKNEVQGSSSVAATIYLVDRSQVVIGDEMTIRIEPYRLAGFRSRIQLQENVGLGYQWANGIVRRAGVLAMA